MRWRKRQSARGEGLARGPRRHASQQGGEIGETVRVELEIDAAALRGHAAGAGKIRAAEADDRHIVECRHAVDAGHRKPQPSGLGRRRADARDPQRLRIERKDQIVLRRDTREPPQVRQAVDVDDGRAKARGQQAAPVRRRRAPVDRAGKPRPVEVDRMRVENNAISIRPHAAVIGEAAERASRQPARDLRCGRRDIGREPTGVARFDLQCAIDGWRAGKSEGAVVVKARAAGQRGVDCEARRLVPFARDFQGRVSQRVVAEPHALGGEAQAQVARLRHRGDVDGVAVFAREAIEIEVGGRKPRRQSVRRRPVRRAGKTQGMVVIAEAGIDLVRLQRAGCRRQCETRARRRIADKARRDRLADELRAALDQRKIAGRFDMRLARSIVERRLGAQLSILDCAGRE